MKTTKQLIESLEKVTGKKVILKEGKTQDKKIYIDYISTPDPGYRGSMGHMVSIRGVENIEKYFLDPTGFTDDEVFYTTDNNTYDIDDLIGKTVVLKNGKEILVTE